MKTRKPVKLPKSKPRNPFGSTIKTLPGSGKHKNRKKEQKHGRQSGIPEWDGS